MQPTVTFLTALPLVFLLTVLILRFLIPVLVSFKVGQRILEIGPRWHKSKEGTPTMGGLGFLLAILITAGVFFIVMAVRGEGERYIPLALTLAFGVGNAAIGFVDDYTKLIKKQNEGLTEWQKALLQLVITAAYLCVMTYTGGFSTVWAIPFTHITVDFGIFAYIIAMALAFAVVNGANFTDGIDGLCSSVTAVIGLTVLPMALLLGSSSLSLLSACLMGATLGFLVYNFYPARVFMGDTGSLLLGGLVVGTCLMSGLPLHCILLCIPYLWELFSSGAQRLYFKLTHGKRIFLMAPYHHHLEKKGWGEKKIVLGFSLFQLAAALLFWAALLVG